MGTSQAPTREHERLFAQLEQEHQRAEQLAAELEATFAAISDAIIVYDVQGIPVRANPAAISVCGIDPVGMDRAVLASQLSIRHPAGQPVTIEELPTTRALRGERVRNERFIFTNAQGHDLIIHASAAPLLTQGKVSGAIAFWHEVTESEVKFRSIVEQSADGIVMTDELGIIIEWNRSEEEITGLARAEVLGRPVRDVLYRMLPERHRAQAAYERLKAGQLDFSRTGQVPWLGRPEDIEIQRPDGTRRNVQTIVFPIKMDKSCMLASISRDVTEHKQAEVALRESEACYRDCIEGTNDLVTRVDSAGRFAFVNHVAERVFGLRPEDCVGLPALDFVHPDDRESTRAAVRRWIENKISNVTFENRHVSRTGQVRDILWSIHLHFDSDGNHLYNNAIGRDITERKQAEQERERLLVQAHEYAKQLQITNTQLSEHTEKLKVVGEELAVQNDELRAIQHALEVERQRYQELFDFAPGGYLVTDLCGTICEANRAAGDMLSVRADWLAGKPLTEFVAEDDHDGPFIRLTELRKAQATLACEMRLAPRAGAPFPAMVDVAPVRDAQGQVVGLRWLLRDITERKRAEERLRRETARAEALARLAARLNSQLDLDTVLNLLCEETAHALGVPATSVLLYRPERQEFVPTATYGLPSEALDQFRPMPRTWYDEFARRVGPLIVVPDVQAVPDLVNMELLAHYGVRTAVVASLSRGGELVGSLNIYTMHGPRTFDEWELALLKALADQAVQAIINARLFAQVHASQEQLRNLAEYLQAAREEERTRIAREIHDEFGQTLTALKMDLAWLSKQLPHNKPRLMDKTRAMSSLLDSTIQLVRRVATELRPGLLDDLGLVAAMEWQAQEFTEHTKIECELHLGEEPVAFEQDLNTAIFRIFQEALTNVARHAGATQVRIDAQHKPDEWVLIIQDNGRGIADNQIADPHSLGLMGMRERARAWGGDVTLEGFPGQGTIVTVHIPRTRTKEAPE